MMQGTGTGPPVPAPARQIVFSNRNRRSCLSSVTRGASFAQAVAAIIRSGGAGLNSDDNAVSHPQSAAS
jgi:hypothetical protein